MHLNSLYVKPALSTVQYPTPPQGSAVAPWVFPFPFLLSTSCRFIHLPLSCLLYIINLLEWNQVGIVMFLLQFQGRAAFHRLQRVRSKHRIHVSSKNCFPQNRKQPGWGISPSVHIHNCNFVISSLFGRSDTSCDDLHVGAMPDAVACSRLYLYSYKSAHTNHKARHGARLQQHFSAVCVKLQEKQPEVKRYPVYTPHGGLINQEGKSEAIPTGRRRAPCSRSLYRWRRRSAVAWQPYLGLTTSSDQYAISQQNKGLCCKSLDLGRICELRGRVHPLLSAGLAVRWPRGRYRTRPLPPTTRLHRLLQIFCIPEWKGALILCNMAR